MRHPLILLFFNAITAFIFNVELAAQIDRDSTIQENQRLDSLFIEEFEFVPGLHKNLHAEPLFIDLIRDLGARKGEKEWNVGLGLTDNNFYDLYTTLVEYEFAPMDRFGLEIELPFSFYFPTDKMSSNSIPGNKLNSLKLGSQFTFLVSEKANTSLALGYIHEFELFDFNRYNKEGLLKGNLFNPFIIAAKRWGQNFHTLNYSGPLAERTFANQHTYWRWQVNTNVHYMIRGTRNFIGVEFNKEFDHGNFNMTIRPQMRVGIADNLLIGIVTGVPISRVDERISTFFRLIYEPGHAHK